NEPGIGNLDLALQISISNERKNNAKSFQSLSERPKESGNFPEIAPEATHCKHEAESSQTFSSSYQPSHNKSSNFRGPIISREEFVALFLNIVISSNLFHFVRPRFQELLRKMKLDSSSIQGMN